MKKVIPVVIILFIVCGAYYVYRRGHNDIKSGNNSNTSIQLKKQKTKNKTKNTDENAASVNIPSSQNKNSSKNTNKISDTSQDKISKGQITQDKAVQLVTKAAQSINKQNPSTGFTFDHKVTRDNVEYYVIHSYDKMQDHIATSGWYYVQVSNGKVYEWDLANDKLNPIK
ncbi:MAG: hypothetical protein K8E24_016100 [Methanobacterium paludis]|nr:hypothetical protein [Methanobacterium paludis]